MTERAGHPELLAPLREGIAALTTSVRWRQHLELQSRFHRYSVNNVLLIAAQRPGATAVAGFHGWRRMHRQVRRGERAIWILAPVVTRPGAAGPRSDDAAGPPATEAVAVVRGFRWVPVFDVGQTDGAELPTVCDRLADGDPDGRFGQLRSVAAALGWRVEDHEFDDGTNGDCHRGERRIRVEAGNAPAQRVKTLVHELAHALLHAETGSRVLAELEAESTAYVVCRALGIDSGRYSFGYVATWAGGGDAALEGIRQSCGRIQSAASTLLTALDRAAAITGG